MERLCRATCQSVYSLRPLAMMSVYSLRSTSLPVRTAADHPLRHTPYAQAACANMDHVPSLNFIKWIDPRINRCAADGSPHQSNTNPIAFTNSSITFGMLDRKSVV